MNLLQQFENRQMDKLRKSIPVFGPGDTVSVHVKIREGERERVQKFEGLCIARRNASINSSFCIRRVSGGFGVERVFSIFSPLIQSVECLRKGQVRRGKLYYVRTLSHKKARIKERKSFISKGVVKDSSMGFSKNVCHSKNQIQSTQPLL